MAKATRRASTPARTKKPRHTAAQKKAAAARGSQQARRARVPRPAGEDRRPDWAPQDKPSRRERPERSERRDRPERAERSDRGERRGRGDRGRDGTARADRGSWDRDPRGGPRQDRWSGARTSDPSPQDEAEAALAEQIARQEARRPARRTGLTASAAGVPVPAPGEGFADLGLAPELVAALDAEGIATPFPIQAATVPDALAGRDVLGRGRTGSGKTLAYGLPLLQRLADGRAEPHRPRALVLTPTRELAMQVVDALRPLLPAVGLRHQLVAGGMSYGPQLAALERGVDLLVATPGRLTDLVERGAADLSAVEVIVLDEADHMSQLGFLEPVTALLEQIPGSGQRLLFSATLDHGVDALVAEHLTDPVSHATDAATASVETMEHHALLVHPHDKRGMIAALAGRRGRTVVFVRTKLGADRVALQLRESGVLAAALHGGLGQAARTRVLGAFKAGDLPVLVATDVAARGIHVDDVTLVLQVDPPADPKDYLHRAGRTARAGDRGAVVTLALPHQRRTVARLLESAGVDARLHPAGPEDALVGDIAGEPAASGTPVTEQQLSDLLRPRRPQRGQRPGGRGRAHGGRQYRPAGRSRGPRRQDAGGGTGGGLRSRS